VSARTHIRTVAGDRSIQDTPIGDLIDTDTLTREQRRELIRTGAAEWRTNLDGAGQPLSFRTSDLATHADVFVRLPVARRHT